MRVAHIIDKIGWGGADKLLLTFTEVASRRDVDTIVIGLMPPSHKSEIPNALRAFGADVLEFSFRKLYDPRAIPTLMFLLKKKRVDVVHTHLSHSNILGSMAAKVVNIPLVTTLHNTRETKEGKLGLRIRLERYCLRNLTSRVIAVGENVASVYRPILRSDLLEVIPNSVRLGQKITSQERDAIRVELMGDTDRTLVLAVGRLKLHKGYHDLLTAFARVHEGCPRAFLAIVGFGELKDSLKEYSSALGISEHVRFLGSRNDVPQLLASADVYVNSSHWEGLSIAMLEAMAAGLPVVATSVGDAEIVLATGGGLFAEAKNPNDLAHVLENLLSDPEKMRTMGRIARECVEKNYNSDLWLDRLLTCYALAQKNDQLENKL